MSLRTRLHRLEGHAVARGCPACRERSGQVVLVTYRELPGGAVAPYADGPTPCPRCGEVPEQVIEVIEVVVESREDVAALTGGGPPRPPDDPDGPAPCASGRPGPSSGGA